MAASPCVCSNVASIWMCLGKSFRKMSICAAAVPNAPSNAALDPVSSCTSSCKLRIRMNAHLCGRCDGAATAIARQNYNAKWNFDLKKKTVKSIDRLPMRAYLLPHSSHECDFIAQCKAFT